MPHYAPDKLDLFVKPDSSCLTGSLSVLEAYPALVSGADTVRLAAAGNAHQYRYSRRRNSQQLVVNIRYRLNMRTATSEKRIAIPMQQHTWRSIAVH
ncbi:hypothetical protein EJV47_16905 [Hymenobacter gummosus]|uniref:Uncharacterized protein n=1 Tax=Hymenobacter gummosus TaxID=1776032 RepID=A0A431U0A9_9BACT|nr:hypothetical protein [Hymenobacter gummosus]RTQ48115.1 hypothetical protein EJV47_16905 [Hymenobacter gummosus]